MSEPLLRQPEPTEIGREYWAHCRRHELAAQRCTACGRLRRYLTRVCSACGSTGYRWEELSGRGTVYAFTICHVPLSPEFPVPYVVAFVDLAEGIRMMTNIVDCELGNVRIGMRVEVTFDDVSADISLPVFRPA